MYTFKSRIRYSETDPTGKLAPGGIVDYFQDCSVFQSEGLGVGVAYLAQHKRAWLLSAWQIVINRLPAECEKIAVSTWASGFEKFHGSRNFTMETEDGEMLAYANSIWAYMDLEHQIPVKPTQEEIDRYKPEPPIIMEKQSKKIRIKAEWEEREPILVRKSWIDSNRHVNNSRYVKAAYNELPEGSNIRRIRVEYRKQALEGDLLYPRYAKEEGRIVVALCDKDQKPYAIVEFRA